MKTQINFKSSNKTFSFKLYLGNLIILLFFFFFLGACQKKSIDEYFRDPQIGDIYLIRYPFEKDTSYQFLRLASFSNKKDSFTFFPNNELYNEMPSKLGTNDFFIAKNRNFTAKEIITFFKKDWILSIRRGRENSEEFNKIKPLEDKDLKFHIYPPYPKSKTWRILTSLKFDMRFDEKIDDINFNPLFTKAIQDLNNTFITINAYMYSEDKESNSVVLSYRPINPKKICSNIGGESLIQIKKSPNMKFKHEKPCLIKGLLKLQNSGYPYLPYHLSEIEFIECIE
jgi:hypothetical protein